LESASFGRGGVVFALKSVSGKGCGGKGFRGGDTPKRPRVLKSATKEHHGTGSAVTAGSLLQRGLKLLKILLSSQGPFGRTANPLPIRKESKR